jgi:YVTN family beta-propeller protein
MNRRITPVRAAVAGGTTVVVAVAVAVSLTLTHGGSAAGHAGSTKVRLAASTCTGPTGAAYIAVAGYQAFDAVNTANCYEIQQYNVADPEVPNTGTEDFNYSSTDEGVAMDGNNLYFADTGNDTVAVIDSATLNYENYENPAETLIPVGINPENLAVTPDGSQVWVADTGPQTGGQSLGDIKVISTGTNTVTATLPLQSDPRNIAFSPSGATAYVTTGQGLYVISTASLRVITVIGNLGDPEGVTVSPDGKTIYVTNTVQNVVDVVNAGSNWVSRTIGVGQLPWQLVLSSNGSTLYVADGDSNAISVISTASDTVTSTITEPHNPLLLADPVSLALTPDGSELWVGGLTSGIESVFSTSTGSLVGDFNVGYGEYAQSGDGEEPTGVVLTTTPAQGPQAPK